MMKIAWVTSEKYAHLIPSEQVVVTKLSQKASVTPVVWDDTQVQWQEFDLVIIRTIWDYHLKVNAFTTWLSHLEALGVRVLNPLQLMRWNHHKFYLEELQQDGYEIVPSFFVRKGDRAGLLGILDQVGWEELVIKPAVSASAYGLIKQKRSAVINERLDIMLSQHDLIVQEFMPEVANTGEWSVMFFNNRYSHAVLKQPGKGEFRVQQELGGSVRLVSPDQEILEQTTGLVENLQQRSLYCRVDGIVKGEQFVLMELELIEPDLFLLNEEIQDAFVKAIEQHL